ncbi:hypothetical protein L1887_20553 [Cichorium endivia]|nr:hypothetical protein L1887_20553 [Cichorium endivia]
MIFIKPRRSTLHLLQSCNKEINRERIENFPKSTTQDQRFPPPSLSHLKIESHSPPFFITTPLPAAPVPTTTLHQLCSTANPLPDFRVQQVSIDRSWHDRDNPSSTIADIAYTWISVSSHRLGACDVLFKAKGMYLIKCPTKNIPKINNMKTSFQQNVQQCHHQ